MIQVSLLQEEKLLAKNLRNLDTQKKQNKRLKKQDPYKNQQCLAKRTLSKQYKKLKKQDQSKNLGLATVGLLNKEQNLNPQYYKGT